MLEHKNKAFKYDFWTKLFHWLMAGIIIYTMLAGFSLHIIEENTPLWHFISRLNISLAFLSSLIFIPRWIWRFFRAEPQQVSLPAIQNSVAHMVHSLMYFLMFFVYVTGFFMLTKPVTLLGKIEYINPLIAHDNICELFFFLHRYSCYLLFSLILLHVGAVIKHQFINKNQILSKMLF
ncbi:cytochrome b/b6 domain-containing protein [uncultured Shewanella sp.]|uniref:cytochrome b n=1 Tax=uncultured Shewanella sp. TaxID=173975 RepID=UPI002619C4CB|nr:cytochrome b/b6 domain-containing protein [uncultured Shewanella sp.]